MGSVFGGFPLRQGSRVSLTWGPECEWFTLEISLSKVNEG